MNVSPIAWFTPGVLFGLLPLAVGYAWLMWGPGQEVVPGACPPTRPQAVYFYLSLLALYVSLGSPLGVLAMGYSFTAHMFQHMIATMAVPPLFILGVPPWLWRWLLKPRAVAFVFRHLVAPVPAIVLFNLLFAIIVIPGVITAMVLSVPVMILLHLLLSLFGLFMWWPMMSPVKEFPALHPATQTLYLFADGVLMILPLALVALAGHFLYSAAYGSASYRVFGMPPLEDQEWGAVLCLTIVHAVYGAMVTVRIRQWAHREPALDPELSGRARIVALPPYAKRLSR